ncbi:helix-turn-helix domain-containing protein [Candidatus Nephthysia bennettiae]|uniref:Helix-turn-helix domain-containing protein n=1 Tax=Candidatus Nephthysia bennettiae TaxID=3127016 RepID=A0A934N8V5_9BACT|nr:helix-turn-helix domain-containing protein [Candidatus Dormibacteraeota bacterium]
MQATLPLVAEDDLLTTGEAARLAGVHRSTVDRWIRLGLLPIASRLPSGHARVRRQDVLELIKRERDAED